MLSLHRSLLLTLGLGLAVAGWEEAAWAASPADRQKRLESVLSSAMMVEPAGDAAALRVFYRDRSHDPAWGDGAAERILTELPGVAEAEGLEPAAYAVSAAGEGLERDVAISAMLLRLGRDLAIGAVPPERAYGGFGRDIRGEFDGQRFLKALAAGRPLAEVAAATTPQLIGYVRLRQALERTRAQARAGGWPTLPDGPKLSPGDSDERVPILRRRLIATGELAPELAEGRDVDSMLVEAVKRFQRRHGLDPDGTVGTRTLAALNVGAEARARQIAVNLERWRWMTRSPGATHIAVNIAAASLDVVEHGAVAMSMRVVVGDVKHPTPSMVTSMGSVVLNPAWSVPTSIANKEILPKLRRDPNYLATSNLKIVDYPDGSPESAGDGIDWNAIGKKFPYRLRQPPGPDNALGFVKFNLKDSDDIYMHDTPNRRVFSRAYRALSHGCVRLEKPVELGELMLGERWQGRLADDIAANRATRTLMLKRSIPVYLMYYTAWTDEDGLIQFREDLYGHDRRLAPVLERARAQGRRIAASR